jgi:Ca-activated chloride channel family protein
VIEQGGTMLYDATDYAYNDLLENGDPDHIRAVVVLTDGADTDSSMSLNQLLGEIGVHEEEGGNAIKVFTIAFGNNAEKHILIDISEATGGKQFDATPTTIRDIYAEIATFF